MKHTNLWIIFVLIIASLQISGCGSQGTKAQKISPYRLEAVEGSDFKRVILTEKAAQRLDIQTAPIQSLQVNGQEQKTIPYAAVMYGLQGQTWTYTNPAPLVFVRQVIVVDSIQNDLAVLSEGPDVGTQVVTVGVAELYGAELGVSK